MKRLGDLLLELLPSTFFVALLGAAIAFRAHVFKFGLMGGVWLACIALYVGPMIDSKRYIEAVAAFVSIYTRAFPLALLFWIPVIWLVGSLSMAWKTSRVRG